MHTEGIQIVIDAADLLPSPYVLFLNPKLHASSCSIVAHACAITVVDISACMCAHGRYTNSHRCCGQQVLVAFLHLHPTVWSHSRAWKPAARRVKGCLRRARKLELEKWSTLFSLFFLFFVVVDNFTGTNDKKKKKLTTSHWKTKEKHVTSSIILKKKIVRAYIYVLVRA